MMALCCFYLWSNQGMIMLSTCGSHTIHINWSLSDYYYIEKTTYPPPGEPSASSCRGKFSLHCWAFAWLNDCANGNEADFAFIQTKKKKNTKSLLSLSNLIPNITNLDYFRGDWPEILISMYSLPSSIDQGWTYHYFNDTCNEGKPWSMQAHLSTGAPHYI